MKKELLFSIIIMVFTLGELFSTGATTQNRANFEQGKAFLLEARDRIYNFDQNDLVIENFLNLSKMQFSTIADERNRLYWTAQVEFYHGLYCLKKQQKVDGEKHFNSCISTMTKAMKIYGEFSDGYVLIAESYTQLMLTKGLTYQLMNGSKLKFFPEKAIQLDSANTRAYQSLAVFLMNAPEALGGGIHKAINMLMKLTSTDKGELFNIYYLLGNAYLKLHDSMMASRYLQLALSLYPHNQWAEDDLKRVESFVKGK